MLTLTLNWIKVMTPFVCAKSYMALDFAQGIVYNYKLTTI